MQQVSRAVFLITFLAFCWLAMQVVHEAGHVLGALLTGGKVKQVLLHPLALSRTDLSSNPHPLVTAWAGPLFGVLFPLACLSACRLLPDLLAILAKFFAGFCCISNGLYLGVGSWSGIGDAGDLQRLGAPTWSLWFFGLMATALGFWIWHRLGSRLGWNAARHQVTPWHACGMMSLVVLVVVLEVALSSAG